MCLYCVLARIGFDVLRIDRYEMRFPSLEFDTDLDYII